MSLFDLASRALDAVGLSTHPASARLLLILLDSPITIDQFFNNLYGKLTVFALALSTFFFAWAALLYGASGTGNERAKQHAQSALYAALVGLALALLAGTVATLINAAATGK
jgi:hypothetical protein